MIRKVVIFGVFAILIGAVVWAIVFFTVPGPRSDSLPESRIKVAASFYIPAEFARQIGGEKVEVISIAPFGVEPHEYEPTPGEIAEIYSAKLFIYQGGRFDAWAERLSGDLRGHGAATVSIMDRLGMKNDDTHTWLHQVLARKE